MTKAEDVVKGLEAGADDYIKKPFDHAELRSRLRVGERTLRLENSLQNKVGELHKLLEDVKQLKELIPICSYCNRVRDDQDYWKRLEEYISEETGSNFTHGVCPECQIIVRSEIEEMRKKKVKKSPKK